MAIKPSDRVIGTSTANKLPIAQESWNPLSKRANDRARSRDGTSRWTIESKASLPEPAARPIPPERTTATAQCRPQSITPALRAAAPTTTDDPVTIHSSGARLRNLGASNAPETFPSWLAAESEAVPDQRSGTAPEGEHEQEGHKPGGEPKCGGRYGCKLQPSGRQSRRRPHAGRPRGWRRRRWGQRPWH